MELNEQDYKEYKDSIRNLIYFHSDMLVTSFKEGLFCSFAKIFVSKSNITPTKKQITIDKHTCSKESKHKKQTKQWRSK